MRKQLAIILTVFSILHTLSCTHKQGDNIILRFRTEEELCKLENGFLNQAIYEIIDTICKDILNKLRTEYPGVMLDTIFINDSIYRPWSEIEYPSTSRFNRNSVEIDTFKTLFFKTTPFKVEKDTVTRPFDFTSFTDQGLNRLIVPDNQFKMVIYFYHPLFNTSKSEVILQTDMITGMGTSYKDVFIHFKKIKDKWILQEYSIVETRS